MCFSLAWLVQLIVATIIFAAVWQIFQILVEWVTSAFGLGPGAARIFLIFRIIIGAIVLIWIVYLCADLLSCLLGSGFGHTRPLLR